MSNKLWAPFLLGSLAGVITEHGRADSIEILAVGGEPIIHAVDMEGKHLMISVVVNEVLEKNVPKVHDPDAETNKELV